MYKIAEGRVVFVWNCKLLFAPCWQRWSRCYVRWLRIDGICCKRQCDNSASVCRQVGIRSASLSLSACWCSAGM